MPTPHPNTSIACALVAVVLFGCASCSRTYSPNTSASSNATPQNNDPSDVGTTGDVGGASEDAPDTSSRADASTDSSEDSSTGDAWVQDAAFDPSLCPNAVLSVDDLASAPLLMRSYFSGSESTTATATSSIYRYHWDVQPAAYVDAQITYDRFEFTAFRAGTYTVTLRVEDDLGRMSCNTETLEVDLRPQAGLYVEAWWSVDSEASEDQGVDLDLHLLHPNGWWGDAYWTCHALNSQPSWADPASPGAGNPRLLIDATHTDAIEVLDLGDPEALRYRLGVYGFGAPEGERAPEAHVRVFWDGEEVFAGAARVPGGALWEVGTLDGAVGAFEALDVVHDAIPAQP